MSIPAWPRRVLITGKGGVGKSTIATALALAAARMGARPLLVEASARASLRTLLGVELGGTPVPLGDGIDGMSLAGESAVLALAADLLHSRRLAKLLLGHRATSTLLRAMPAVAEVAAVHVLTQLTEHAPVVVDLEATGHARMWFELRDTLAPVMNRGPIAELLARSHAQLVDPKHTGLLLVTRPESLAVSEALESCTELQRRGGVMPRAILVNATTPSEPAPPDQVARVLRLAREHGAGEIVRDLELVERRAVLAAHEREVTAPLWDTGVPILWLPRLPVVDRTGLATLGSHISRALFEPPAAGDPQVVGWT